jgi:signal transduction histidine kinase/tetratricopeptide (TPR) repeat protein
LNIGRIKAGLLLFLALLLMGVNATHGQSTEQLISQLSKASKADEKIELNQKLAFKYQNQQAFTKAIDYYREIITLIQKNPQEETDQIAVLKNIGFCYEQTNNLAKQIEVHQEIATLLHQEEDIISNLKTLSVLHLLHKDYKQSLAINKKLIEIIPTSNILDLTNAYNNLGLCYKKLGDETNANIAFNQCYDIFTKNINSISVYHKITILINLGIMHAQSGYKEKTKRCFDQALAIAESTKNDADIAKIYNYKAAYELSSNESRFNAKQYVAKAIALLEKSSNDLNEETQLTYSYKLISEIYQEEENWKEYVRYNQLYIATKDKALQKEKRLNQLHLEKQLSIEKKENQLRLLIADKDKKESELKSSHLEKKAKEKELAIKEQELILLKQNQALQNQIIKNEHLEKEKVEQLLILTNEKNKSKHQKIEISLLQKNKELHHLTLIQKKKEIQLLEFQNKINSVKLEEEKKKRTIFTLMIIILAFTAMLSVWFFKSNRNKNKALAKQNQHLMDAQKIIHAKNDKLKTYSENLENLVQQRTQVLTQTNTQLINNNNQLEQFSYILAHNIKAPIARLIGLGILFKKNIPALSEENQFIVNKIDESVHDLNHVIKDLNVILDIKAGNDLKREKINLISLVDKIKLRLETHIQESNSVINVQIKKTTEVYSVKAYIESIIYNLVNNALKYRSERRNTHINITYSEEENFWIIKVKDNGLGIDLSKYKDKLFGLYKRFHTHIEGKGMGLYLVKVQVESLGGEVLIESIVDEYTEFTIKIPMINA